MYCRQLASKSGRHLQTSSQISSVHPATLSKSGKSRQTCFSDFLILWENSGGGDDKIYISDGNVDSDSRKLLRQCHQIKMEGGLNRIVLNFRKRLRFRSTLLYHKSYRLGQYFRIYVQLIPLFRESFLLQKTTGTSGILNLFLPLTTQSPSASTTTARTSGPA